MRKSGVRLWHVTRESSWVGSGNSLVSLSSVVPVVSPSICKIHGFLTFFFISYINWMYLFCFGYLLFYVTVNDISVIYVMAQNVQADWRRRDVFVKLNCPWHQKSIHVQWWFVYPDTFVPGRYFRINEFSSLLNRPLVRTGKSVPTLFVWTNKISRL